MADPAPKKKAAKKKAAAAPAAAAPSKPASQNDMVKCRNKSNRIINVKGASLKPGDSGECTVAQLRQFRNYLEPA